MSESLRICLDVGITQTRAWILDGTEIVARATRMQGIRGGTDDAIASIDAAIADCLRLNLHPNEVPVQYVAAAGMVTSELGPYSLAHLHGTSGMERLAESLDERTYVGCVRAPLFLARGLRFGSPADFGDMDAMRGEETLFMGLLNRGLLRKGDALLNLGSHWKLIRSNTAGEITGSYTGIGGELALAISRETILKAVLPEVRPVSVDMASLQRGKTQSSEFGLARALFLLRMHSQRERVTSQDAYWYMIGAIIADALPLITGQIAQSEAETVAIAGYPALTEAWSHCLSAHGIATRLLTEGDVEECFCAGLISIVEAHLHKEKVETKNGQKSDDR
jgi:2-dehydro-3-deoxygalactonokinase